MSNSDSVVVSTGTRSNGRWLIGGFVVLFGVLLLLDTTDTVAIDGFDVLLASAFVVYGAYRLVTTRFTHLFWPITLVLVGTGWLLVEFGVLTGTEAGQFWPVLVVLYGVTLVLGRNRRNGLVRTNGRHVVVGNVDDVDRDGARSVTAVFEDADVDLRAVERDPDDPPLAVDVTAVFGDATVRVPEDWVVAIDTTAVFGEVRDRRRSNPAGSPDLVVDGAAIFGDITLLD
ncbi:cell wall-active antibiotics response protein [Halorubellus salinus]|uniref:cell wall-active antibiotics response protein n=1 Tax=Halorubellus salinus TaxID=755309 RepID=UPI001D0677C1|nr:cell wall-active antibiotics response protein [Halorubellus salinus]